MTYFREIFNPATGELIQFTQTAETTGGELARFTWRSAPGGVITEQVHPHQEECFPITSGEARCTVNGHERHARAGETLVVPAGVPHSEGNPGTTDIEGIVELRPALRAKEWHEALAGLVADFPATPRRERPLAGLVSDLLAVRRAGSGRAKEGQYCEHTAVVLGGVVGPELAEDLAAVGLDGLGREGESGADRLIGAALGDEREYLVLAFGEFVERPLCSPPRHQPGNDRGVYAALSLSDAMQRVEQYVDVGDALLEEVAGALGSFVGQSHGVARLRVVDGDKQADVGVTAADLLCGDESLIGVSGRHADVDVRDVGAPRVDRAR